MAKEQGGDFCLQHIDNLLPFFPTRACSFGLWQKSSAGNGGYEADFIAGLWFYEKYISKCYLILISFRYGIRKPMKLRYGSGESNTDGS